MQVKNPKVRRLRPWDSLVSSSMLKHAIRNKHAQKDKSAGVHRPTTTTCLYYLTALIVLRKRPYHKSRLQVEYTKLRQKIQLLQQYICCNARHDILWPYTTATMTTTTTLKAAVVINNKQYAIYWLQPKHAVPYLYVSSVLIAPGWRVASISRNTASRSSPPALSTFSTAST